MDNPSPISILHLEDSELDADLELAYLNRANIQFRTTRVQRRAEFERSLNSDHFDLILADFKLPDFNGLEALALAREAAPLTPFIFVSGMLGEEIAIKSLRNGATDYVLKMRLERLAPAVLRAVSEARERADRLRMEAALAESESRFRNMADSAPVMIWTAQSDTSWNYCNRLWREVTGLTIEESSGSGWTALVHHLDLPRVLESYNNAFETCRDFTLEYRLRRRDGEYRWIVNRAVPRFDNGGLFVGFIGSCTDITELKASEERLRHAAKLESLGILAGGIAHDFNNLLTGIMANASLVIEELKPGSRAATCLGTILRASEAAARLTHQMLAFSGRGHFVLQALDFSQLIQETLPLIAASVPRLVDLKLQLDTHLGMVEADLGQMQQLVMNLVINGAEAIGSSPSGTVTIRTGMEDLDTASGAALLSGFQIPAGRYVVLSVRDSGHGMDSDTQLRIFDPFFTTKFVGRGLGLAAVSGIVRGHKGGLSLTSDPGKGTEFRVYIPALAVELASAADARTQHGLLGSGVILLVDDEEVVSQTASLMLETFGYTVLTARDGKEAVDLFRDRVAEIDLVILDMTMPVMSGEIAFQQMRAIRPDARILVSSGYDEAEAVSRFGKDLDSFIQKPYLASQFAEKVQAAMASR